MAKKKKQRVPAGTKPKGAVAKSSARKPTKAAAKKKSMIGRSCRAIQKKCLS